ncbi:hypothetical protein [uncultured Sphaerochaeta sp.]|uniref:hypothetical protein n=1 Tax=uncultured Sphaerochaeta sp. TaxID=886478 RepID=UPI002630BF7B|nr:hypothetical protein [uncultured Sphaerochaeta sp.]
MCLIELPIVGRTGGTKNKTINYKDILVVKETASGAIFWVMDRDHPGRVLQLETTTAYSSIKTSLVTTYATHYEDLTVTDIGEAVNIGTEPCLLRKEYANDVRQISASACYLNYKQPPTELRVRIASSYLLVLAGLNS